MERKTLCFEVEPRDYVLKHIFECGQCFRWNENEDGSYTGIAGGRVATVRIERTETNVVPKQEAAAIEKSKGAADRGKSRMVIEQLTKSQVDTHSGEFSGNMDGCGSAAEDMDYWKHYFDADTDYGAIKKSLEKDDTQAGSMGNDSFIYHFSEQQHPQDQKKH